MRDAKFRAWDKSRKLMVEPFTVRHLLAYYNDERDYNRIARTNLFEMMDDAEYELMQFTGLHDKNGKEIYEGDIVSPPKPEFAGVVEWCDWLGGFVWRYGKDTAWRSFDEIEIIGNIYENPDIEVTP